MSNCHCDGGGTGYVPSLCVTHGPQITKASETEVQFLGHKISEIRETPPTSEPSFHSHRHNFSLQPCCQMKFDTCDSTVNPGWDLNRTEMIIFLFLFLFPASISSLPLPISLPLLSLAPGTEKAWPLRFPPSLRLVLNTQQIKAQARKLTLAIYFKPPHPSR